MQDVRAIRHRCVSQHSYGHHLLFEVERLVLGRDYERKLLIPRGDVTGGGDVKEQRREHVFQAVLVAAVYGFIPGVFNLLKLLKIRRRRGSDWSMHGGRGGIRALCKHQAGENKYNKTS